MDSMAVSTVVIDASFRAFLARLELGGGPVHGEWRKSGH
jgi:hypothetical protein